MQRGHGLIVGLALAGAAVAFAASDRDHLVHEQARIALEEGEVRADLDRIEQQAALGGFETVHRAPIGEGETIVPVDVEVGACAVIAGGAWGDLALHELSARRGRTYFGPRYAPPLPLHAPLTQHTTVCAEDAPTTVRAAVRTGWLASFPAGGAELLVLVGDGPVPPLVAGRMVVVEEEVVVRRAEYGTAATNAAAVFFFLALFGLIAHVALSRGKVSRDGESSLRRVSVVLPSALRAEVDRLVSDADRGSLAAAQALRDWLAHHAADVYSAHWEHDRASALRMKERASRMVDHLRRRGAGGGADYRSRGAGYIVLTLVLEHACELPDFPTSVGRAQLAEALVGLLPVDPRELMRSRAMVHPADPSLAFDDEALARAFPELRSPAASLRP